MGRGTKIALVSAAAGSGVWLGAGTLWWFVAGPNILNIVVFGVGLILTAMTIFATCVQVTARLR